jgi:hypothetical protein
MAVCLDSEGNSSLLRIGIVGGVDVSSIAAQVPSWAWPIVLICITALFQFLRNLADSRHKEELAEVNASTQEN